MTTLEIQPGAKMIFTPTGAEFQIKTVTDKKVVWYTGFIYNSAYKKYEMRTSWTSRKIFEAGIEKGIYKIIS